MSKRVLHARVPDSADTFCGRHMPVHGGMASTLHDWLANDRDRNQKRRSCKACVKVYQRMKDEHARRHH